MVYTGPAVRGFSSLGWKRSSGELIACSIGILTFLMFISLSIYSLYPLPESNKSNRFTGQLTLEAHSLGPPLPRPDAYFYHYPSLHLGWNNVRFIIATSLNIARLLNRTLVLPSHLYMRSCAYADEGVCQTFADPVRT